LPAIERNRVDETPTKPRFSIVAHSFGGILAREIAFRVAAAHRDTLDFSSFVTIASPHAGVRMGHTVIARGGWLIGHTVSQSIHELCLNDAKPIATVCLNDAAPVAGAAVESAPSTTAPDTVAFSGQLASRLVDAEHIAALARFDDRLLVANLTNDHLVPYQTASLLVDAAYADLCEAVGTAERVTEHTLPMRRLTRFGSDAEARASIGAAHWNTAEGSIVRALRGALDFDLVPVAVSSRYMRAHPAIISHWMPFQMKGMDDVSHLVAQYVADRGVPR
jgi:hypothetical protein